MKKPKKKKVSDFPCGHKGCTTRHKSATGFCYEHVEDIDKHTIRSTPHYSTLLYEEKLDLATTPRITLGKK